jgi:hypothetical protein
MRVEEEALSFTKELVIPEGYGRPKSTRYSELVKSFLQGGEGLKHFAKAQPEPAFFIFSIHVSFFVHQHT